MSCEALASFHVAVSFLLPAFCARAIPTGRSVFSGAFEADEWGRIKERGCCKASGAIFIFARMTIYGMWSGRFIVVLGQSLSLSAPLSFGVGTTAACAVLCAMGNQSINREKTTFGCGVFCGDRRNLKAYYLLINHYRARTCIHLC